MCMKWFMGCALLDIFTNDGTLMTKRISVTCVCGERGKSDPVYLCDIQLYGLVETLGFPSYQSI